MTDRKTRPPGKAEKISKRACALLWDESLAWGLMARRSLHAAGLPFDLLNSEEIRRGVLSQYRMLFVPGGWASNKRSALGDRGCAQIRRFVEAGGNYLGICGGAGLATGDGIRLLSVRRKPTSERVASFSGPIRLTLADHRIWRGVESPLFFVWWPSQLQAGDHRIRVLATYEEAQPEAFSADIPVRVGTLEGWHALEKRYGILLDPDRLRHEPAVMEGSLGRGRVILSLVHFDTPGDPNGSAVLRNLWEYLSPGWQSKAETGDAIPHRRPLRHLLSELAVELGIIESTVGDLMETGSNYSLWRWRNPFLLQWRRGVRGLEYGTLAVMIREIREILRPDGPEGGAALPVSENGLKEEEALLQIREQIVPFVETAKELLDRERLFMRSTPLSPLECPDPEISRLRSDLFGTAMSHGGRFKPLIDSVDRLLTVLIREG